MPSDAVAIISGGGQLPVEVAFAARESGHRPTIFAMSGFYDAGETGLPMVEFGIGQIDFLRQRLADLEIGKMVLCGRFARPDLKSISWDLGALKLMPRIAKASLKGDDGALKTLIGIFLEWGVEVVGPADVAPSLVMQQGPLGRNRLRRGAEDEIELGLRCLHRLDDLDVGQSAVVIGQRVVAIEAAEGTDAMLARVANLKQAGRLPAKRPSGVLVKTAKPSQDLRLDMPVIGPDTIKAAGAAQLTGIALGAGRVLLAGLDSLEELAREAGIAVQGIDEAQYAEKAL